MNKQFKRVMILGACAMIFTGGMVGQSYAVPVSKKVISYIRTWPLGSTTEDMKKGIHWKAEDIQGEKLSTLNIAFAHIVEGTNIAIEDMKDGADGTPGFKNLFEEIAKLQAKYPDLRINLSIGGWGADGFSDMAATPETRKAFIANVMGWVTKYGFNGVDIDWEYPVSGGWGAIKARPEDKTNFTALMTELRQALDAFGVANNKKYELSVAAAASPDYLTWIEPEKIAAIVDYAKLMCYDFYGSWSETTGHLANLYGNPAKPDDLNVDAVVQNFLKAGFPVEKLLLGVPFYGRAWKGVPNTENGLYQKAQEATYPDGITYPDILALMKNGGFTRYWDDVAKAPYLYNGDVWITYEDEQSLTEKIKYIQEKGLRGMMVWEYAHDMNTLLFDVVNKQLR